MTPKIFSGFTTGSEANFLVLREPKVGDYSSFVDRSCFVAGECPVRSVNFSATPHCAVFGLGEHVINGLRVVSPVGCNVPKTTGC